MSVNIQIVRSNFIFNKVSNVQEIMLSYETFEGKCNLSTILLKTR